MNILLLLFVFFSPILNGPETWNCTNDVEITCEEEGCEVSADGEFTPMSATIDTSGAMSVCAYSGCWEGTGSVLRDGSFLVLTGTDLTFSTAPDSDAVQSIVFALDTFDGVGVIKAGSFAHPMICTIQDGK